MKQGYEYAQKKLGVEVVFGSTPAEEADLEQLGILQSWLAEGSLEGYVVTPFRATSLNSVLTRVSRKNLRIINIDELIPEDAAKADGIKIAARIASNNVEAGKLDAQLVLSSIPKGSDVAIIEGDPGTTSPLCCQEFDLIEHKSVFGESYCKHFVVLIRGFKWSTRHLKPPCPRCSGSPIPGGGLFRRPRFSSGQIRNAASGPQRRHSGQPSVFELRFLATFLLQSPGGFYPGGSGRVDWQEERPKGAAQAQRGNRGFCGTEANSRPFAQNRCFTQTDPKQVRDPRASTDFGTGSGCREKKNLLATADSVKSSLAQAPELIEQYERLRQQVLGRNLSCDLAHRSDGVS
jgi:hypothetical protein